MKYSTLKSILALALVVLTAMPTFAEDEAPGPKVTGYAIGQQFGGFLKDAGDLYDQDALMKGFNDAIAGNDSEYEQSELQAAFMGFQQALMIKQQELNAQRAMSIKEDGAKFLADNAKRDSVTVLPSGLQYEVIEAGNGKIPVASDTVIAHYRGTFIDGEEFDSSYTRGEPSSFPVTRVIPGWTEALQKMKVGDKWKLFIPYDLAYGEQGNQRIPGGSTLLFDIELVGIK